MDDDAKQALGGQGDKDKDKDINDKDYTDTFDLGVPFSISPEFFTQAERIARMEIDQSELRAEEVELSKKIKEKFEKSASTEEFLAPDEISKQERETEGRRISHTNSAVIEVSISKILPNPYQPRKNFDLAQLEELANSIKEHGVIQPLVVNETPRGYELVIGERRFRASQLAGLEAVPVIVKTGMGDQQKLEIALIENIQRQELNPIEEAQAYDKLIRMFGLTQEKVAAKLGKSRPAIANTVRLLNLPAEIQRGIIENNISEGHARAILGLTGMERQMALYKMILEHNLNVRQVESKVRELMARPRVEAAGPDSHTAALEYRLRDKLGSKVKIEKKGTGGKVMIEFYSEEELQELIERIENTGADKTEN